MNVNEVIKFPVLSEKTYAQMAEGVYTFAVDPRTNRAEVKKTIEYIFEVKVAKVNIISIDKKPTKLGRSHGFTNKIKKAIVTLSEGQINIFPDEVEAPSKDAKETKETPKAKLESKTTKTEMSEAEKKAAAKIAAKAKAKTAQETKASETKASSAETTSEPKSSEAKK